MPITEQQTGQIYRCRFIEAGLVAYADVGTILVQKPALDAMLLSFVGKPVFNEIHKDTSARDFSSGLADGVVTRVWYEPADGWFWCEFLTWDEETKRNCESGSYSVSCAYDVATWSDAGGVHNNIPYAREVLGGTYTHLAIVPNPRYEGARIIYNAKGGNMKLAFWRKDKEKPEVRNASEFETDGATLTIDGKDVPVPELIELYNAKEQAKAETERKNAIGQLKDDDELEIGGKKVTVKDLKNCFLENASETADDDKDEERKNAEKEKEEEERKNAEKEKEEDERKNAEKAKEEEERKNATHFEKLKNAAAQRPGEFKAPTVMTLDQKVAEGSKRYGPKN